MSGYIKEYRSIIEWEWYTDYKTAHLFRHCILKANIECKKWQGMTIERGSFVTSLANLSKETGLSIQNVRTSLNKLKSTQELTYTSTSRKTIITINNYNLYQDSNTNSNKQLTNNQQTTNKQLTTTKEYKNIRIKENKNLFLCDFSKKTEEEKKEPFCNSINLFFIEEYQKIFNHKPYLSASDRNRLLELSAENKDIKELIPVALKKLKEIDFKDINYKPSATWLLRSNNFERVLNGEFDKKDEMDWLERARLGKNAD